MLAAETAGMILGGLVALRLRLPRLLFFGVACCLPLSLPVFVLGLHPQLGWLLARRVRHAEQPGRAHPAA